MAAPTEIGLVNQLAKVTLDAVGAAIVDFEIAGKPIISRATAKTRSAAFAGVTLAPWPNRLAAASWTFNNLPMHGEVNEPRTNNRNHGLVFDRQFEVKVQTATEVVFEYKFGGDSVYPFQAVFQVMYVLEADALHIQYSIQNLDSKQIPFAVGGHPYLRASEKTTVQFSAGKQLLFNERQLPTGKVVDDSPTLQQLKLGMSFGSIQLDDCFTDLKFDSAEQAITTLRDETNLVIEIIQQSSMPYLMIYTVGQFGYETGSAGAIAIEPLSAAPNALNTGEGLTWLEPNQVKSFEWSIRVRTEEDNE